FDRSLPRLLNQFGAITSRRIDDESLTSFRCRESRDSSVHRRASPRVRNKILTAIADRYTIERVSLKRHRASAASSSDEGITQPKRQAMALNYVLPRLVRR